VPATAQEIDGAFDDLGRRDRRNAELVQRRKCIDGGADEAGARCPTHLVGIAAIRSINQPAWRRHTPLRQPSRGSTAPDSRLVKFVIGHVMFALLRQLDHAHVQHMGFLVLVRKPTAEPLLAADGLME
jgi:hypothetical protein